VFLDEDAEKVRQPPCSFRLFGLSGLFGCMRLAGWTRQTGFIPDVRTFEAPAASIVILQPVGTWLQHCEVDKEILPARVLSGELKWIGQLLGDENYARVSVQ
jgi:hypothetical protein